MEIRNKTNHTFQYNKTNQATFNGMRDRFLKKQLLVWLKIFIIDRFDLVNKTLMVYLINKTCNRLWDTFAVVKAPRIAWSWIHVLRNDGRVVDIRDSGKTTMAKTRLLADTPHYPQAPNKPPGSCAVRRVGALTGPRASPLRSFATPTLPLTANSQMSTEFAVNDNAGPFFWKILIDISSP